jgi:curli biogenesis system outer membrane secretion channel CsgG
MNKLITFSCLILIVFALSACTTKTTSSTTVETQPNENTQKQTTAPSSSSSATKTDKPVATFAPTTDADIKMMDKDFDSAKSTDFDDKTIDDIAK